MSLSGLLRFCPQPLGIHSRETQTEASLGYRGQPGQASNLVVTTHLPVEISITHTEQRLGPTGWNHSPLRVLALRLWR